MAVNNLQRLMCHKTQPTKPNEINDLGWNSKKYIFFICSHKMFYFPQLF